MISDSVKNTILREHGKKILTKSPDRIKSLGEVFTPPELVIEILEQLPESVWEDGKTYLDPTAGDGNFLAPVLIIKMSLDHTNPLSTIYGVDLMQDNVDECRQRLLDIAGDTAQNRAIVERNILCRDGLTYDYSFGDSVTESLFGVEQTTTKKAKVEKVSKVVDTNFGSLFG